MGIKRVQTNIDWTPEDLARHRAIREAYQHKPTIEQLVQRGELSGHPMSLGKYVNLRLVTRTLNELGEDDAAPQ